MAALMVGLAAFARRMLVQPLRPHAPVTGLKADNSETLSFAENGHRFDTIFVVVSTE